MVRTLPPIVTGVSAVLWGTRSLNSYNLKGITLYNTVSVGVASGVCIVLGPVQNINDILVKSNKN